MGDLICSICGKPVTDEDEASANFYDDEFLGLVHGDCYDEAQRNDGSDDYDDTRHWHDISHER